MYELPVTSLPSVPSTYRLEDYGNGSTSSHDLRRQESMTSQDPGLDIGFKSPSFLPHDNGLFSDDISIQDLLRMSPGSTQQRSSLTLENVSLCSKYASARPSLQVNSETANGAVPAHASSNLPSLFLGCDDSIPEWDVADMDTNSLYEQYGGVLQCSSPANSSQSQRHHSLQDNNDILEWTPSTGGANLPGRSHQERSRAMSGSRSTSSLSPSQEQAMSPSTLLTGDGAILDSPAENDYSLSSLYSLRQDADELPSASYALPGQTGYHYHPSGSTKNVPGS